MAKYATGTVASADAMYTTLRTHILANGWTLIDTIADSAGNRDQVFKGAAIDTTADNRPYVRIQQINASQSDALAVKCYTDWDTTAHVGMNETGGNLGIDSTHAALQSSSMTYWMRANKYAFTFLCNTASNPYQGLYAGFMRRNLRPYSNGATKSTGAIAAGDSTVPLASDMTGKWYVNQKVILVNHAHSNASANKNRGKMLTIQAITGGGSPSVTFTTTVGVAFDAGTIIGQRPQPLLIGSLHANGTGALLNFSTLITPLHPDGSRSSYNGQTPSAFQKPLGDQVYDNPGIQNVFPIGRWDIVSSQASKTGTQGSLYHWRWAGNRTAGFTLATDVLDDQLNTFLPMSQNTGSDTAILGPRN